MKKLHEILIKENRVSHTVATHSCTVYADVLKHFVLMHVESENLLLKKNGSVDHEERAWLAAIIINTLI